jgi:succinate dehydrogenase / fumarate reductase flavoprotein subunit/fumarate reductase flavoprotein subunit
VVSRSCYLEIMAGRGFPNGSVHIVVSHLGAEFVEKNFPGMCQRCRIFGYDLARKPVPVSPTAHFMMGGALIDTGCRTSIRRLFCAGEDSGGVHGANRLGGNGIADSCVFGRLAGKSMARFVRENPGAPKSDGPLVEDLIARYTEPFGRSGSPGPLPVRDRLREMNWGQAGIVRSGTGLREAAKELETLVIEAQAVQLQGGRPYSLAWQDWINLINMLDVSRMLIHSAIMREESRGAHYREDFPKQDDSYGLFNLFLKRGDKGMPGLEKRPVNLNYVKPSDLGR